jgi:hypothetical protein
LLRGRPLLERLIFGTENEAEAAAMIAAFAETELGPGGSEPPFKAV